MDQTETIHSLGYRAVYSQASYLAWKWFEAHRELPDPDHPAHLRKITERVRQELGNTFDRIEPATAAEAIIDAMDRRRPRW